MRSLICLFTLVASPALACPPPPPGIEVVANDKATIAPDGGLILRIDHDFANRTADPRLVVHADGKPTEVTREYITFNVSVLKPKVRGTKLEVLRGGKVINTFQIVPTPALAAPKLVRVSSTAPRPKAGPSAPPQIYPPTAQISVELGGDRPADAFTLVVYKLVQTDVRAVASGMPDAKLLKYSTGGKQCMGGYETIYPGEKIAVAWLDVHGKLSPRSQPVVVAASKP